MADQRIKHVPCICQECGKLFSLQPSRVAWGRGKHCSRKCAGAMKSRAYKGRKWPRSPREKNPNWRGRSAPKNCPKCGGIFSSINKYCCRACADASKATTIAGDNNPFRKAHPPPKKKCRRCGVIFERRGTSGCGTSYCSASCSSRHAHVSLRALSIADRLMNYQINVKLEKSWPWLISPIAKRRMRVDIYLPDFTTAIEYDGRQHREIAFAGSAEKLARIQARDAEKDRLLALHGVRLIRISHWPVDTEQLIASIRAAVTSGQFLDIAAARQRELSLVLPASHGR